MSNAETTANPSASLAEVIASVGVRVSYLRAVTAADGDGWLACHQLANDSELLSAQIIATAPGRGTSDHAVAASLFIQAYAFRVASISVAAWALDLPVPSLDAAHLAIRIGRHRPAELAICNDQLATPSAAELHAALVDAHLAPLIATTRAAFKVGERLLWGNALASIVTVLRAVQSATGPRGDADVRLRADALLAAGSGRWTGLGNTWTTAAPLPPAAPQAIGWHWERTNCCLWYQTEGGFRCDDCSLHNVDELRATRTAALISAIETA